MKKIVFAKAMHRGQQQLTIGFSFNNETKDYVKLFTGVRWSQTLKTFYVAFSAKTTNALYKYLRNKNYFVDHTALKNSKVANSDDQKKKSQKVVLSHRGEQRLSEYRKYLYGLRLSTSTVNTYSWFISFFLCYIGDTPLKNIGNVHIRLFVEQLTTEKKYSISTHRQLIGAIKHFADLFGETKIDNPSLKRPKKSKILPNILSQNELIDLLRATANLKHRATLALLYSTGMRISEVINLQLSNIDIDRKQIIIKQAKGRKDRYVIMAESFIPLLKNYVGTYRPEKYFIEGVNKTLYSASSIRAFLKKSCKAAGITKRVTPHTLRHSYATHLIESGVGLRHVQELLGHSKPETTMIYTQIAKKDLLSIKSPLDTAVLKITKSDKEHLKVSLSGNYKG